MIILLSDEELATQIQQGDELAFETIVRRYHAPIHAYIARMGGEHHIGADIVQEVFIKVCRHIHCYKPDLSFRPWIYTIASNTYKDYLRKAYVQKDVLGMEFGDDMAVTLETPETVFLDISERERVLKVVDLLGEIHREVLVLRYYQDLKLEEIALVLQIPLGTVKSRLSTALHYLKKMLIEEGSFSGNAHNG